MSLSTNIRTSLTLTKSEQCGRKCVLVSAAVRVSAATTNNKLLAVFDVDGYDSVFAQISPAHNMTHAIGYTISHRPLSIQRLFFVVVVLFFVVVVVLLLLLLLFCVCVCVCVCERERERERLGTGRFFLLLLLFTPFVNRVMPRVRCGIFWQLQRSCLTPPQKDFNGH